MAIDPLPSQFSGRGKRVGWGGGGGGGRSRGRGEREREREREREPLTHTHTFISAADNDRGATLHVEAKGTSVGRQHGKLRASPHDGQVERGAESYPHPSAP